MTDRQGRPPRRRAWIVALVLALSVVIAAIAACVVLAPRIRSWVIEEAGKRGLRLAFTDYSLGLAGVELHGVSFARERPVPISGQAKSVILHWTAFELQGIEIEQLQIDVLSSVPDLLYELRGLSTGSQGQKQLPLTASGALLRWKTSTQDPATLTLSNATLALDAERLQTSGDLRLADQPLGKAVIDSVFATRKSDIDLAFSGETTGSLSAVVDAVADPASVQVTLKPTHVQRDLPGLKSQSGRGGDVSGSLELHFPTGLSAKSSSGKLMLSFDGFVPPHPPELLGLSFGGRTTLESDLLLSRDYRTVTLKNTRLEAGAFTLAGSGSVERHDGYATAHLQMNGRIGCASIAEAAANANLGGALGEILSKAARQVIEGSVDVALKVQADSRNLDAMQIEKTIGLGCGLRPAKLSPPPLPK